MIHRNRRYQIQSCYDLADLVQRLTTSTWCGCQGFCWNGLLILNDSFSADGAQEYTIVKNGKEIESLTVSWMTPDQLTATLEHLATDPDPVTYGTVAVVLESQALHRCGLCA